jgi:hypothetical protein
MSLSKFIRSKRRFGTGFEQLEDRRVLAVGISLSSGVLTITGDSWENDCLVSLVNNKVHVRVESVPSTGFVLTPDVKQGDYTGVSSIRFYGNDGDDTFDSTFIYPCILWGGSGNDVMEGGGGNDWIYGGSGNDTLRGVGGHDTLYGGDDNDKLYGGNGCDGLYGGAGADELFGGNDADRFLVMDGANEHKDATSSDAVLRFKNGDKTWKTYEIEQIDAGLRTLHMRTLNDNLLETSNAGTITIWRQKSSGAASADNNSVGRVNVYDGAFSSTAWTTVVIVHEMGHNWDNEHAKWNDWLKLSGWTSTKPSASVASKYEKGTSTQENWWYLKTATFTRDYAKTNPREDFASSWERYFIVKSGLPNPGGINALPTSKYNHLDAFFSSIS